MIKILISLLSLSMSFVFAGTASIKDTESDSFEQRQQEFYNIDNGGSFSFEKQFDRIQSLKNEGKKVGLILGRTVTEGLKHNERDFIEDAQQSWAFMDLNAKYGEAPHFVMDITDINAWEKFGDGMFNYVVFDWTVFDYVFKKASELGNEVLVFSHLTRILEPAGIISFNSITQFDTTLAGADDIVVTENAHIFPLKSETSHAVKHKILSRIQDVRIHMQIANDIKESTDTKYLNFEIPLLKEKYTQEGYYNDEFVAKLNKEIEDGEEALRNLSFKGQTVVEHTINSVKQFSYSKVEYAKTRPWGNYDAPGFFIATKQID